jgi:hypothetical protein
MEMGDIKVKLLLFAPVLAIAAFAASASFAEDCRQYPEGPVRHACVGRNPVLAAKRERCKQEAENMGLTDQKGVVGALKNYVAGCMKR